MAAKRNPVIEVPRDVYEPIRAGSKALMTTQAEFVRRAVEAYLPTISPIAAQQHLGDFPALPTGYHRSAARLYLALVDAGGGPVKSQALADLIPMHRGNVDRHLTRLRSDGYVRRTAAGHVIVRQSEKDTPTDDDGPTAD